MCEKEFNDYDYDFNCHIEKYIDFGSKYDLNLFKAHLCCDCFDKILDTVVNMFKKNPLKEYDLISKDGALTIENIEDEE